MANTKSAKAARAGKMSKKRRRQERLRAGVALFIVLVLALGIGLGFYLSRGGQTASELFVEGQKAAEQGNYNDAIKFFQDGVKKEPNSPEGYILIGNAYSDQFTQTRNERLVADAIDAYRKAVSLAPDNTEALLELGRALLATGAKQEAATYLKKVLALEPNRADRDQIEQLIQQTGL
jgi:cytochrome c-type biogenesis protein CcmH/NrfG